MSRKSRIIDVPNCPDLFRWIQQYPSRDQQSQENLDKRGKKYQARKKNEGDPNIIKSPSDYKEYRHIKLTNGLNVLLISDLFVDDENSSDEEEAMFEIDELEHHGAKKSSRHEVRDREDISGEEEGKGASSDGTMESDISEEEHHIRNLEEYEELVEKEDAKKMGSTERQSAAALAICVGSFCDPDKLPGLAHLLEHMVFMGSKKYPEENGFDAFLKTHGGTDNASTGTEQTVFQFEVQKKHFKEALDRWAQFFIHPLMIQDAIHREIEAVDSEYQLAKPSDENRRELLLGSLAKPGHPMRKFFWGNAETLKYQPQKNRIDTYARLRDFYKRHYSAHYMNLVVQSRETLDTLEKWVTEIFSQIPNNGMPRPTFNHLLDPFDTPEFHKLYKVVPVKEVHCLSITWALPPQEKHYRVKPLHYISWLIGHEGKGSVLSLLRKNFLALSLYGGNNETAFEQNSTYSIFSISVTLTDKGFEYFYEVTHLVFQYLKMLQRTGPVKRIWEEIQKIESIGFCFQEQTGPIEYVENICENMHFLQKEDLLTGDQLLTEYNPEVIADAINYLIPQKVNLFLLSPAHEGQCPLREKWFGTQYSVSDIDGSWSNLWNTDFPLNPDLHLPEENKYIATDFSLKKSSDHGTKYPHKILDTPRGCLWYKRDNKFLIPKAFICFHLVSPLIRLSATNMVLFDTFESILIHNLAELAYEADLAQLEYKVVVKEHGLVIRVQGFNHKLPLLFQLIIDRIADFSVTLSAFQMITDQLKKSYFNLLINAETLAKDLRLTVLEHGRWSLLDKYEVVNNGLSMEALVTFVNAFKSRLWVEGLVQGNFTSNESKEFLNYIADKLQFVPLGHPCPVQFRVIDLPVNHFLCKVKSLHVGDANSIVTVYYQTGPRSIKESALMELLVMHMEEPCFDYLRTKQTLGYHVYPATRNTSGILGFSVTVATQATKYNSELVDRKIEEFLFHFEEKLQNLSHEQFKTQVSSLVKLKQADDAHLGEEVERNWIEVLSQQYLFDRFAREIVALKSLSRKDLVDWFLWHRTKTRKVLSTHVVGYGQQEGDSGVKFTSAVQESLFSQAPELTFLPSSPIMNCSAIMDIRAFTLALNFHPYHKIIK
ncbi:nardilysin-like [Sphaerodactylus townsendi]|uniref:nardilysin-like n=1 Tax=Sphaerodactylus townsendi TaxID=933632 RepID=UPI002026F684|nr:nardilysin-like [Sphaerodactylus townsendi]